MKHFLSGHWINAIKTTTRVTGNKNIRMQIMAHGHLDYRSKCTAHLRIAIAN